MREIVTKLVDDAKKGDKAAIRILLAYGIGSPSVNIKNAVIVSEAGGKAPLPAVPSRTLPGTPARVEDMAKRVANGQTLFSPKDRKAAEG
jgi:uridine phosphorylase